MLPILVGILLAIFTVTLMCVKNKVNGEMRLPDGTKVRLRLAHKIIVFLSSYWTIYSEIVAI